MEQLGLVFQQNSVVWIPTSQRTSPLASLIKSSLRRLGSQCQAPFLPLTVAQRTIHSFITMAHKYEDEELKHDLEERKEVLTSQGCGVCHGCGGFCGFVDRNRVVTILFFAAIGVAVGVGLSFWDPEDPNDKKVAIQWIGLIGDLFLRALKCFVLPVSVMGHRLSLK